MKHNLTGTSCKANTHPGICKEADVGRKYRVRASSLIQINKDDDSVTDTAPAGDFTFNFAACGCLTVTPAGLSDAL